jgi:3-methyladenine DNA glycosylase AlkD
MAQFVGTKSGEAMTLKQALKQLESLGTEKMRAQNAKHGAGDNQFGVRRGDVRKLAKKIKTNQKLAMALWGTENIDAQFLAILQIEPKSLSSEEVDEMVGAITFVEVADWFTNYVIKKHADKEVLRQQWMESENSMAARAGWSLTSERVAKSPDGLDIPALLKRIASEMGNAELEPQWTMNFVLAEIGINFSKHRKRALAIGEQLGVYRDYRCSKGCTSPFAPIWINEMVSRQKA